MNTLKLTLLTKGKNSNKINGFNQINGFNLMNVKIKHIQVRSFEGKTSKTKTSRIISGLNISYMITGSQIPVTSCDIFLKNWYMSSPQVNAFISKLIIA